MRNVFWLLLLMVLLTAGWINRDKLGGMGGKRTTLEDEPATPTPEQILALNATPAPAPVIPPKPPAVATPVPATPRPTPPRADPLELIKKYRDSLVFVTGGEGAGSGFIADMAGKTYLITNAHVAAGVRAATFNTLQGTPVKVGAASVAVGHDVFAMQVAPNAAPFEILRDVENNVSIGEEVVVLGNAEGGGVINNISGRILGLGPNLIEIDAPFLPGNSGSPIIHLRTSKVIGVATYLTIRKYDSATSQTLGSPSIRRFGYRMDSVKTWQPVNWNTFYAQATEMENIEKLTRDFVVLIKDIAADGRVSRSRHSNPVITSRIDAWLAEKSRHLSPSDKISADQNFVSFLKTTSQADVTSAQQHMSYDYFQRQLTEQQRERTEIAKVFARIVDAVK